MADEERCDCPRCGTAGSARVVYERFGTLTWWCLGCEYAWEAHAESLSIGSTQREEAVASLRPAPLNRAAA